MELVHTLPISSIEELKQFEEEISSNCEYKQFMVCHLKDRSSNLLFRSLTETLFVSAVNRTVNDVMSLLMENGLGMQFCMKGRNPSKVSFERYFPRTIDLVFEVLKSKNGTSGPQLELVTIGRSIGEWFRLARLRKGVAKSADGAKD
ncbi:hypothetical protein J437_LFUL002302 [Ladona fulva]|uniref:Uncharacterized protein n=1 Tax=Ladona fulva TaxID=123851 RepID=A0A8K0NTK4_LADFU|nr:hypothetical protein J437_LFUL002302 [Ladona fulva]